MNQKLIHGFLQKKNIFAVIGVSKNPEKETGLEGIFLEWKNLKKCPSIEFGEFY